MHTFPDLEVNIEFLSDYNLFKCMYKIL